MKTVSNKLFYRILFNEEQQLLEFYWLNLEHPMTEEDFKQASKELTRYIIQKRSKRLLISYLELNYAIPNEMQYWFVEEEAASWLNSTLKKIALVVNHDLLIQNSLDNIIEETNNIYNNIIENRFFFDCDSAKKWLLVDEQQLSKNQN